MTVRIRPRAPSLFARALRAAVAALTLIAFGAVTGCTTTDPYTGEQRIDPWGTAAVVGGLVAAGVLANKARDDDDDDDDDDDWYSPARGIACNEDRRACYDRDGRYSRRWSEREFGDDWD